MLKLSENSDCCGCGACVQRCPKQCVSMQDDAEGFLYPKIDLQRCIDCGMCEAVCPVIHQDSSQNPVAVYAGWNPDESIRRNSSSGGVFTALAGHVISLGGVVFGARFNTEWEVIHDYTETREGLSAFRGSKYAQSRIGESFLRAEQFLKQKRRVLFSGTACQIAGLKKFLRKEYDNLLTVDVICHGAPSPGVWLKYLREILCRESDQKDSETIVTGISFRNKDNGWKKYVFSISGKDSRLIYEPAAKNLFMRGFLADLYLRPSCYVCPSKSGKCGSDITLGDFWNVERLIPGLDDDKGLSLILANTDKGREFLSDSGCELHETDYSTALASNPVLVSSVKLPPGNRREKFFSRFEAGKTVCTSVAELTRLPFSVRIKRLILITLDYAGLLRHIQTLRHRNFE